MIGLDTNVLIRYLTQDDPVQSAKATEILERRLTPKNPRLVGVVAMVETVWVLDRAYALTAPEIATAIERLLQVEVLAVENEQKVFTAVVALKQGWGSFADALIAELWSAGRVYAHAGVRPKGGPASCLRACIVSPFGGRLRLHREVGASVPLRRFVGLLCASSGA
jgi:predicted nucleic-acid-binding protein